MADDILTVSRLMRHSAGFRPYSVLASRRVLSTFADITLKLSDGSQIIVSLLYRAAFFSTLGIAVGVAGVRAQSPAPVTVVTAPAPSPTVAPAPAPAADSPAVATPAPARAQLSQMVYARQLPSAAELTTAATAQGFSVERITQTATEVVATYRNTAGQLTVVAYRVMPPNAASAPAPAMYETSPRVVYYDYPDYYYPRSFVGVGFGRHGFRGGHFRHRR